MTVATGINPNKVISPDDFNPPLKRTVAALDGYWTVEELAAELEVNIRSIQYAIKGNLQPKKNPITLRASKVGPIFLVSDTDALEYLWKMRQFKNKSKNY